MKLSWHSVGVKGCQIAPALPSRRGSGRLGHSTEFARQPLCGTAGNVQTAQGGLEGSFYPITSQGAFLSNPPDQRQPPFRSPVFIQAESPPRSASKSAGVWNCLTGNWLSVFSTTTGVLKANVNTSTNTVSYTSTKAEMTASPCLVERMNSKPAASMGASQSETDAAAGWVRSLRQPISGGHFVGVPQFLEVLEGTWA